MRLISAPRAFPFRAVESGPSVASIAFNGRAFCKEGGRGHELGEGILPARSVGWGGKFLDLGRLHSSSLKSSYTLKPIMYVSAVSHLHVES